jgi:adenylosuccinate synthase
MPVTAVIGGQWGDEGKGKIIDLLAEKADFVIRFSGGDNAGHTVINPQGEFKLHLIPSGIFNSKAICILSNGVAINPEVLLQELDDFHKKGVNTDKLYISQRAHLIMPYHTVLDRLEEERKGKSAIGTTLKGIGPVFSDKIARLGIRAGDLLDKNEFKEKLRFIFDLKNALITKVYGGTPLSFNAIYDQYCRYGDILAPYIKDTDILIRDALSQKKNILLEGAQGTMLDPDFGSYPFVTSSSPLTAGASLGSGISFNRFTNVIGVFKAYLTRVGAGAMPTELKDETGNKIRELAHEYGTTTGRARRCGWFDSVIGRFSSQINGYSGIALTRLDILDTLPVIKICTGYKLNGKTIDYVPTNIAEFDKCQPILEEMPGWQQPTSDIKEMKKLPKQALQYISRLEKLLSCPAHIISVGPKREQTIVVKSVM